MTIHEILQSNPIELVPELIEEKRIYPSIEIKGSKNTYLLEFVDHTHPDIDRAKDIERNTFTELGDKPEEVDAEFFNYDESSIFVLLRPSTLPSSIDDTSQLNKYSGNPILGMARFIPFHDKGNKTFNDLASLAVSARQRPLNSFLGGKNQILDYAQTKDGIINLFMEEYGCTDIEKVIDIATLAPDMGISISDKMDVIESLLKAMDVFVIDLHDRGQLTHLTQFTAETMHGILINHFGYPMHDLFSLPPLVYDTFGNDRGYEDNMVAVPSVISLDELAAVFKENLVSPTTKHMASVVTQLAVSFSAYTEFAA